MIRIHSRFAVQGITLAMTIVVFAAWSAMPVKGRRAPLDRGQVKDRVIALRHIIKEPEPCEISEFRTGGTRVTPGEPFQEDGDWLNNLSFSIKNVSGKPLTMVRVNYSFPEATTRRTFFVLQIGHADDQVKGTVLNPILLPPGGTFRFEMRKRAPFRTPLIPQTHLESLEAFLIEKDLQMSNLTKVDISLYDVQFNDNTGWGMEGLAELDFLNRRWVLRGPQ